jgi:hypothetical protein
LPFSVQLENKKDISRRDKTRRLLHKLTHPFLVQLADALRKVNVDPPVVDQNIVHFEIGLFAVFTVFEFDERVLQGIAGLFISDDFAAGWASAIC